MNIVQQIKQPIQNEMELFEKKFRNSMTTKVALLNRITYYIVNRKGKQMRPMFVFLVAKMVAGEVNERTYRGASVIELIHTATLVHDDVVDDSNKRRGFFSLNALWKNKIAVLVGDYLLAKGLLLSIDNGDFDLLRIISVAVREMSEGELLQIEKARRLDITEEVYYEIIRQKTATLIAACCSLGAAAVDPDNAELIEKMRKFGELIGMAFQIKDDLFDYTDGPIGKPTGIDIKEQKMTLPLIYTLNTCEPKEKKWLINSVKNHNEDKRRVKEVIAFVKQKGGLEYATTKMVEYQQEALNILQEFPESTYREALFTMVNYVIERKK
ncbi:polyprenyl synthetase family protein [Myroides odoratimimus]|uniref:Polyprenyl synthetase n=2 Tax=Myroides odoratimimus TaxID=76832 RepID=A0AAI8C3G6_9FLAO|nr:MULTISPECIES: polyprenyl synthetase family protein [Myroides]ALU25419.1 polyprenyl synthetase [Myroides odoratimimus]MCO7722091.1 polyprenyl synthetase family protein [Myroides odoratimimus]MDM1033903.1 polyprenyl synthetase family protein [Myroides odoratimimus]MDM1039005.1 polyprenyl synthetase family protein [Myroides odoratimimus]MDM1053255.1 polyprenyl synthetase family protein [Myroides odoratimimus]